jgi:hypothetical protein
MSLSLRTVAAAGALAALAAAALLGCTEPDPAYCDGTSNYACPAGQTCNVPRKECVAGGDMAGADLTGHDFAGGCTGPAQCGNPTPFCTSGQCAPCTNDPNGDGGASMGCAAIDATRPLCSSSGACVACLGNADCAAAGKSCQMGACAPCVVHADCASGYCKAGVCVDSSTLVYVSKACSAPGTGTFTDPYCAVQNGLNNNGGKVVVVEPGSYAEDVKVQADMMNDFVVTAVAAGAVTLQPTTAGVPAVQVLNGAGNKKLTTLTLDGFTISGVTNGGVPPAAVSCDGSANGGNIAQGHTTMNLLRDTVTNNVGVGVSVTQCVFSADRLKLKGNLGGGLSLLSSNFTVDNALIYGNGTSSNGSSPSLFGGIDVVALATTSVIFNATVVGNNAQNSAYGGINCSGTPLIVNTVILGNSGPAGDVNATVCKPSYSGFSGATAAGTGTSNQELMTCQPGDLFVSPGSDDYHPKKGSVVPCTLIDDGIDGFGGATAPDHDFDGLPRPAPMGGKFDIGAYEAQ